MPQAALALVCIPQQYDRDWFIRLFYAEMQVSLAIAFVSAVIAGIVYLFCRKAEDLRRKRIVLFSAIISFVALQMAGKFLAQSVAVSGSCDAPWPWAGYLAAPLSWLVCALAVYIFFCIVGKLRRK